MHLVIDDRRNAKHFLFCKTFRYQLFISRLEDMQVQLLSGIDHNTQGKYGNEVNHESTANLMRMGFAPLLSLPAKAFAQAGFSLPRRSESVGGLCANNPRL
jgi:hypothetical protein